MGFVVRFLTVVALTAFLFGCSEKPEQKAVAADGMQRVQQYLQGVQVGDKVKMYQASNLTKEMVDESREKLIHPEKSKQTEQQRKDSEHALRASGNIDFIAAKINKMLPKSANFQITKTTDKGLNDGAKTTDYSVKITYNKSEEAVRDKTGRAVKEMIVHLLQISRSVNGSWVHNFSIESEKIADKNFEVLSYF